MVQEDSQLAIVVLLVTERVLHFDSRGVSRVGENVRAHCKGNVAMDLNLVVSEHHI